MQGAWQCTAEEYASEENCQRAEDSGMTDGWQLTTARKTVRWLKKKAAESFRAEAESGRPAGQSESVARAVCWISQEYKNPFLGVGDIAERAGISVNRLNDLFKQERNETVGRFLTRVRMEQAKRLLDGENARMAEIACAAGYTSTSYFARVFRKYYGMSPQEYRMKRRKS